MPIKRRDKGVNEPEQAGPTKTVVILGVGFSGLTALKKIEAKISKNDDVGITLIDQNNYFTFAPLLHQVAVGALHPWDIVAPFRTLGLKEKTTFLQARVARIDLEKREISTTSGIRHYDFLLISLGSKTDISGMVEADNAQNVFTLKSIEDATAIKNRLLFLFEKAASEDNPQVRRELLSFTIAGGGYAGAELAAALSDMVFECAVKSYRSIDPGDIRINIIEVKDRLIDELPEKYSGYIAKHLKNHHVRIMCGARVTSIGKSWVEINGNERLPTNLLVWVTGVVANPVISGIGVEHDELGRIFVDDYLSLPDHPEVYIIGDCAHYHDEKTGQVARPRAHHAVRQAKTAAENIMALIEGRPRKKYKYSDSMVIVSLGRTNALFRFGKYWLRGLPALLIWLAAYSLLSIGVKNRFLIDVDWILSRVFGPDMAVTVSEVNSGKEKTKEE
jgi:NADH dehydrogenase